MGSHFSPFFSSYLLLEHHWYTYIPSDFSYFTKTWIVTIFKAFLLLYLSNYLSSETRTILPRTIRQRLAVVLTLALLYTYEKASVSLLA